eukprot:SAG31_NODE_13804_length_846_cov_0.677376_1_plen_42_part_10
MDHVGVFLPVAQQRSDVGVSAKWAARRRKVGGASPYICAILI